MIGFVLDPMLCVGSETVFNVNNKLRRRASEPGSKNRASFPRSQHTEVSTQVWRESEVYLVFSDVVTALDPRFHGDDFFKFVLVFWCFRAFVAGKHLFCLRTELPYGRQVCLLLKEKDSLIRNSLIS